MSTLQNYLAPLVDLALAATGWLLFAPLTLIIPRNPRLVIFFGRDGGKYTDNCKHLFATFANFSNDEIRAVYFAKDCALRNRLRMLGGDAVVVGSSQAWWLWLTAGTIVVDNIDWPRTGRYPAARGARLVQLWHGIPLKHVQLTLFRPRLQRLPFPIAWGLRLQRAITGRFARSDIFLSTSRYVTDNAFTSAFTFVRSSHAGYPRNDVLMRPGNALAEYGVDETAKARVAEHRRQGRGIVGIYAPTFRRGLDDPFQTGKVDLRGLSEVATELGILLLVKLHPWMYGRCATHAFPSIQFVEPDSDSYPLMRETDFLITDYSSIFFDYLLRDRPVLFFPYDLEHYLKSNRPMYFNYDEMTPGPKVRDIKSMKSELHLLCSGVDAWKNKRAQVRHLVFEHEDALAGERLMQELFNDIHMASSTSHRAKQRA